MSQSLDTAPLPALPPRPDDGHKGTFGTLVVVGGCCAGGVVMAGAPALAGRAALRAGAGLCRLLMPGPVLGLGLGILPSATGLDLPVDGEGAIVPHAAAEVLDRAVAGATALVVGPGLGSGPGIESVALRLLSHAEIPIVADADAINAMARIPDVFREIRCPLILTPHPGEFRRLAESMRLTLDPTSRATRPDAAAALAQRLGCVVVLKGAGTIVSDGLRTWRCDRGHPCLATAGTGDVLAGLLAGLIAQHWDPLKARFGKSPSLYDLARIAVDAHARAGERWAERHAPAGLLAQELADLLPEALAAGTPHHEGASHDRAGTSRPVDRPAQP